MTEQNSAKLNLPNLRELVDSEPKVIEKDGKYHIKVTNPFGTVKGTANLAPSTQRPDQQ